MRIVIAEKNQDGRRLLAKLLRMEGHDVLFIEEGSDATWLMKQYRPEIILMDMFNVSRNGGMALGRAEPLEEVALSPVVVVTSMIAWEKMYGYMGMGGSNDVDAFDNLSANAKIGTMENVQRICEVLARSSRSSGRNGEGKIAMRSPVPCLLDPCG